MDRVVKMWNKMSLLQKVFVVVALLTIMCSICTDCVLCQHWPMRVPSQLMNLVSSDEEQAESFQDNAPEVVLFYAMWCPHCKALMPEWNKLEKQMQGSNVDVKKVDCEKNPEEAKKNNVDGFPTILLFKDGKSVPYEGDRTADAIKDFISSQ